LQSLETQASISLGLGMLVHQVDDLQGKWYSSIGNQIESNEWLTALVLRSVNSKENGDHYSESKDGKFYDKLVPS
jgi:hypothetical protein